MMRLKAIPIFLSAILTAFGGKNVEVPSVVVAGVGRDAIFRCNSFVAVHIEWLINGTSLASLQLSDVEQGFDSLASQGTLRFLSVPVEYNGTIAQCIVHTTSSGTVQAPNSTLLLQGTLSAVGAQETYSVDDSTVFLNWTAPFTLDIAFISPDIAYCVDVVSSTSSATLHSECGITETEFTYPLPPRSWCDEYSFTVTPVNVVGNGTKRSRSYKSQNLLIPDNIEDLTRLSTNYTIVMSAPVCTASLSCMNMDNSTEKPINIRSRNLNIAEANITLTFQQLLQLLIPNRRYAFNVTAENILGEGTAPNPNNNLLSTHDITECSTNFNSSGVEVIVKFVDNSNATGALVSFIFMEGEKIDFSKSFFRAVDKDDLTRGHVVPIYNFFPGDYEAFFYDIESDGRIPDGVAYQANSDTFEVISDQEPTAPPQSSSCTVSSLNGVISVSCPFDFQVTVQFNDVDMVDNLEVYTCTDSDPATILVQENGTYLVTILKIIGDGITSELPFSHMEMVTDVPTIQGPTVIATVTPDTPPSSFKVILIAAATASVIFLAFVVAMIVTSLFLRSRNKGSRPIMFIEGAGVHRTCSISYRRKSGPTVFSTPEMYDSPYSVDEDVQHEQVTEHDMPVTTSSSSFSIQEENSKPDDFSSHVYSVVNKANKTHTPTSMSVVAPVKSSSTGSDSFVFGASNIDSSQAFADTEDGHYSTLDHSTTRPAEINPSCEDSKYSVPVKYQNPEGQEYALLLQLKNSTTTGDEHVKMTRSILKVEYSEVQPAQNILPGPQPRDDDDDTPVPSQQDETQMLDGDGSGDPFRWHDHDEKIPLIPFDGDQMF